MIKAEKVVISAKREYAFYAGYSIAALTNSIRIKGVLFHEGFFKKQQIFCAKHVIRVCTKDRRRFGNQFPDLVE